MQNLRLRTLFTNQLPQRQRRTNNAGLSSARLILLFFVTLIGMGTFLLWLPFSTQSGQSPPLLTAFFTATSAVCVTGLVVVDTGSYWSFYGQGAILFLLQLGGLGYASSAILALVTVRRRSRIVDRLALQTAVGTISRQGVLRLSLFVLKITLACEALGALLLFIAWVGRLGPAKALWWAIFHAISAFTNGSFDITGTAVRPFISLTDDVANPFVVGTIAGLIICGGIGFVVLSELWERPRRRALSIQTRIVLRTTLLLLSGGTLIIWLLEHDNPSTLGTLSLPEQILAAFFQSVCPRTAGFDTIPIAALRLPTLLLLLVLMVIGGGSGSTAGGIKIGTVAVLFAAFRSSFRGERQAMLYNRAIPPRGVRQALIVVALYGLGIVAITVALTLTETMPLRWLLFEVVSAFGTVGLTLGATPHLSGIGVLLIAGAMFVGRLGPLGVLVAVWAPHQPRQHLRYPEEDIAIS